MLQGYRALYGSRWWLMALADRLCPVSLPVSVMARGWPGVSVWLRSRSTDILSYRQIFLEGVYAVDWGSGPGPSVIVDAGANIGMASVWFAVRYPSATIIALEPEPANYRMLVRNTGRFPNVKALNMALWHEHGELRMSDPGLGNWGFTVCRQTNRQNLSGKPVAATTVDELMGRFSLTGIDILKIDIEGSEKEVFEHAEPWIGKVDLICVELHDRHRPGCSAAVAKVTSGFVELAPRGDTKVLRRRGANGSLPGPPTSA